VSSFKISSMLGTGSTMSLPSSTLYITPV
jgi:hypothetical protein